MHQISSLCISWKLIWKWLGKNPDIKKERFWEHWDFMSLCSIKFPCERESQNTAWWVNACAGEESDFNKVLWQGPHSAVTSEKPHLTPRFACLVLALSLWGLSVAETWRSSDGVKEANKGFIDLDISICTSPNKLGSGSHKFWGQKGKSWAFDLLYSRM